MSKILFSNLVKGIVAGGVIGVMIMALFLLTFFASIDSWHKTVMAFSTVVSFIFYGGFVGLLGGIVAIVRR